MGTRVGRGNDEESIPLTTKGVRWQCRGKKKVRGGRSRDSNLSRLQVRQRPAAAESGAALQGTDSDCGGLSVAVCRTEETFVLLRGTSPGP